MTRRRPASSAKLIVVPITSSIDPDGGPANQARPQPAAKTEVLCRNWPSVHVIGQFSDRVEHLFRNGRTERSIAQQFGIGREHVESILRERFNELQRVNRKTRVMESLRRVA